MRKWKRGLASFLAVMMLFSALPATALAAEEEGGQAPAPTLEEASEEVVYNLLDCPITVGSDETRAEEYAYALFDEQGNYTIPLEDNAFFPYEVQFTYGGETWETWFMDPEDTVEVGGHVFSVTSEQTDPLVLTQIGLTVGGEYIPAYPEEKEFSEMPSISPASLLPLETKQLYLELQNVFWEELKTVSVSAVLAGTTGRYDDPQPIEPGPDDKVVWAKFGEDTFQIEEQNGTIDLTPRSQSSSSFNLELLVGDADQFNPDNLRYLVNVKVYYAEDFLDFSVCSAEESREPIDVSGAYQYTSGGRKVCQVTVDGAKWESGQQTYLSMGLVSGYERLSATVYEGYFNSEEAALAAGARDITSQIWDQSNMTAEGGYLADYSYKSGYRDMPEVTLVLKRDGNTILTQPYILYMRGSELSLEEYYVLYAEDADGSRVHATVDWNTEFVNGIREVTYTMGAGYPADGQYYVKMNLYKEGESTGSNSIDFVKTAVPYYCASAEAVKPEDDIKDQLFSDAGTTGGYLANFSQGVTFTVLDIYGKLHYLKVTTEDQEMSLGLSSKLYQPDDTGRTQVYGLRASWDDSDQHVSTYVLTLPEGYAADAKYYYNLTLIDYSNPDDQGQGLVNVQMAVPYYCTSASEMKAEDDIKDQLFSDASTTGGYLADFSKGIVFSILAVDGTLYCIGIRVEEPQEPEPPEETLPPAPRPDSEDTYFRVMGAEDPDTGDAYEAYVMPYWDDSYYYKGYQTVFLLERNTDPQTQGLYEFLPVTSGTIVPVFEEGSLVTMYAGLDQDGTTSASEQKSGETETPFTSGSTIQYSAAAEAQGNLKNYWVTFLTQQSGPKLFVNGTNYPGHYDTEEQIPVRWVNLDEDNDYHHDIFIANVGDQPLTGLKVELSADATNVALDEYWTVREDSTGTLAAFSDVDDMRNIAKIRLVAPEGAMGEISGKLTISADGQEPVVIKLTGIAGVPEITTSSLIDGVKYVPYATVIQTNSMEASDAIVFSLESGSLPEGITLQPNGVLYGVPTEEGDFTFTVKAVYTGDEALYDTATFTLTVLTNSDTNVDAATDMGYELLDRVPAQLDTYEDQVFRSQGQYGEFYKFYLDGRELVEGQDFDSEEGSTKITIRAQTFRDAGRGTHTIAAEFRTDKSDTNTVKRAAQNYTVSSSGSGGGSSGGSKPAVDPGTKPQDPATTADIFWDVSSDDWFYPDVDWAYQQKLMIGVTSQTYAPYGAISPATVVTVLSRMDKVDLNDYAEIRYPQIDDGQWYTNAANWAMASGLLPDEHFTAQPPIARAKFAVMLVKYLQHSGIDCTLPEEPVTFADASLMTQEENDAFQVLYQFGIFKGVGNYYMDPQGSTTRAQLAVLLHRLSVFVENQKV